MKKIFAIALGVILAVASVSAQSVQDERDIMRERRQIARLAKTELNKRVTKATKDAMKQYKKEGWKVNIGGLPLDKQLDRAYKMQFEFETAELPKYIMGEATALGENYDAAKMQAMELAKISLAGQIQTEVTALIESTVSNKQISSKDAASISESVMSSKNLISQSIGRIIPVIDCYRDTKTGMKEVRVMIAYSYKSAADAAKSAIKADLAKKGQDLHDQIDQIMGF